MKKLNITKERFEKSRYFNRKYGKLEYVSESGRLFKTNKGKVLMFNESASAGFEKFCEELKTKFSDIDGVKIYLMDNEDGSNTITVSIRRFDDARSVWYPEDVKKIGQFIKRKCDRFGWTVEKNVEYRLGITDFYITEIESSDDVVKESSGNTRRKLVKESTGDNVEVCAVVKGRGQTIEEAIENFDREIDNLSSDKWGDWSANYDPETDEYKDRDYWTAEYNKWQEENGGDVDITVVDDRGNAEGFYGHVTISNTDEY